MVASFPGRSHFQFLIACSMQNGLGERVTHVMSSRHEGRRERGVSNRCNSVDQP